MQQQATKGLSALPTKKPEEKIVVRYCLYARKSSEPDELQALSIDSQIKEMVTLAEREYLEIADIRRESHSAKLSGARPVYNQLIQDLKTGVFNGILTWAPDRLSRNGGDLGAIVDLMDSKKLVEIRTYTQKFTNSPNEKFLLMILGSQAKLENDNKSINVVRGLKTRAEMGLWPCVAPTGYLNNRDPDHKCEVIVDPVRGSVIKQIFEKVGNERWSGRKIHAWLKNDVRFKGVHDNALGLSMVYRILKNPFYTGIFEYPKESGNWYHGKHKPLISEDIFRLAQEKIAEELRPKKKFQEFTFTKLMTCGYCQSGITAQEKSKNIADGTVRTYIYYSCTRHKDHQCKNPYLREESLVGHLSNLMDTIALDEIGARHIIDREVAKHNDFRAQMFGTKEKDKAKEINVRDYAKYMLKNGNVYEVRELLEHLRSRIVMRDRKISLEKVTG